MNSCACASARGRLDLLVRRVGPPKAMFSRTVAEKRNGSCEIDADRAAQRVEA